MTKEEFKKIRIAKSLYQRELADELGVATVTVKFYENGLRKITKPISKLMSILKKSK